MQKRLVNKLTEECSENIEETGLVKINLTKCKCKQILAHCTLCYSSVNEKWYKNSWKEFDQLKNIYQKYYCWAYYDVSINKYGVKCRISLRFW